MPGPSFSLIFHSCLRTDVVKTALFTMRFGSGGTDIPSMIDQTVAEITALFRRDQFPQRHLHLLRILDAIHKSHPVHQSDAVGIRNNGGLVKYISHNQIGTLSANSRNASSLLKSSGTLPPYFFQHLHAGTDIPCLTFSQSTRADNLLNLIHIRCCQRIHIRKFLIEILYYHIHSGIRTLGCQPHTDQQLPGIVIVQRAVRIRIFLSSGAR